MTYTTIRKKVFETVQKAQAANLVRLSAGNISARTDDGHVAITPGGIKYDQLVAGDIAIVNLESRPIDAPRKPSSETPMHTIILRDMPDVGAVVHTHSPYAITFAVLGTPIPTISLELLVCGAPIPVAPWACPGTPEPGHIAVEMFKARAELKVLLLRNHGLLSIGEDLDQAFELAYDAEVGMQIYHQALMAGKPNELTTAQIEEVKRVYSL